MLKLVKITQNYDIKNNIFLPSRRINELCLPEQRSKQRAE